MDTEGAASHAFVDRLFCRIAGATSVYGVGMYDITLNEWFRHLAVCGVLRRAGNAVPPPTAAAIAGTMGKLLLLTWSGETISLGSTPIWVQPIAAALMAAQ